MEDEILLAKWFQRRDAEAFHALTQKYGRMVYASVLRVLGNGSDAEEIAQECFEKLCTARRAPAKYLGPWLHRMAVNRALDRRKGDLRRRQRESIFQSTREDALEPAWEDVYPLVDEAIARLPQKLRTAIIAHFLEGLTHGEIARREAISREAVTHRIERGLEAMRKSLQRRGVGAAVAVIAAALDAHRTEAAPMPATLAQGLGRLALSGPSLPAGLPWAAAAAGSLGWLSGKAIVAVLALLLGTTAVLLWPSDSTPEAQPEPVSRSAVSPDRTQPAAETGLQSAPQPLQQPPRPEAPGSSESASGGIIQGRVYDADTGKGLAANITVLRADGWPNASTDADGAYRISGLSLGQYELRLGDIKGYPGHSSDDTPIVCIDAPGTAVTVDFPLRKGLPVSGWVHDVDGNPVEGASVYVQHGEHGDEEFVETATDGLFTVWGFESGEKVHARAVHAWNEENETRSYRWAVHTVGETGLEGVELKLQPLGSIAGKVVNANGEPVSVSVKAKPDRFLITPPSVEELRLGGGSGGVCDENGGFEITELFAGDYRIGPSEEGSELAVTLAPGQHVEGILLHSSTRPQQEEPGGNYSIQGWVTGLDGAPLKWSTVNWESDDDAFRQGHVEPESSGHFVISGLLQGTYTVTARGHGHAQEERTSIRAGDQSVVFRLHALGVLDGQVSEADTGAPLPVFSVGYYPVESAKGMESGGDFALILLKLAQAKELHNPQGTFHFDDLEPGEYYVVATAPEHAPKVETVTVRFGEQEAAWTSIQLSPEARIAGRVVDGEGNSVAHALIFDTKIPGGPGSGTGIEALAVTKSDAEGRFDIEGLPPGTVTITAFKPGLLAAEATLTVYARQTTPISLTLQAGGIVEGMVYLDGTPAGPGHTVVVRTQSESDRVVTGLDGSYRLEGIQSGDSVELCAELDLDKVKFGSERWMRKTVVVEGGRATRVDFAFRPLTATLQGRITIKGQIPDRYRVSVEPVSPEGAEGSTPVDSNEPNCDYATEGLPTGPAVVCVSCSTDSEHRQTRKDVLLKDGANILDFDFTGGGVLSGKVSDLRQGEKGLIAVYRSKSLKPDFVARLRGGRTNIQSNAYAYSLLQPDGSYHLEGLPPNEYTVIVAVVDGGAASEEAALASMRLAVQSITLEEGAEIQLDAGLE